MSTEDQGLHRVTVKLTEEERLALEALRKKLKLLYLTEALRSLYPELQDGFEAIPPRNDNDRP